MSAFSHKRTLKTGQEPNGVCCGQERRCALSYASEDGELLDAHENVVSYVPLLRGAQAFCQA